MTITNGADGSHSPVQGRRALVTGAASGIGLAIATHLHRQGALVVLSDMPGERLDGVGAQLRGSTAIAADLSVAGEPDRLAREAGAVDILVNNAGLQHVSPIEDFDESKWRLLIEVMLTAPFLLIRDLIPGMYERGWGRIINVASVHGLVASPFKAAYISAKHGVVGLTKTVALEAAGRAPDVTAHAICPSYVRTPMVENQMEAQARTHGITTEEVLDQVMLQQNAVKRLVAPEDVAAVVEFLCRDGAWSMTGAAITMDAGWLAH
jgi:3-hydroxybutyrate dehydrogenase